MAESSYRAEVVRTYYRIPSGELIPGDQIRLHCMTGMLGTCFPDSGTFVSDGDVTLVLPEDATRAIRRDG